MVATSLAAVRPQRIVVAVDTSPESLLALDHALQLADRAGSSLVVVHV